MTSRQIVSVGDRVLVEVPTTLMTPGEVRTLMRQLSAAVHRAEYVAVHAARRPEPEAATVAGGSTTTRDQHPSNPDDFR